MEPHQLRIAISILIRAARNATKTASYDDDIQIGMSYAMAQEVYNPIAKANLLEGAHGWRKDSLLRRGQSGRDVARALQKMKPDPGVHPSLTDFGPQAIKKGPVTKYALKSVDSMVQKANRSGISFDMLVGGLWSSAMLPGVGGDGLMDSSTEDFWFKLGRTKARDIKSGRFTLAMANGATNKKLTDLAKNLLKSVGDHGQGEDVSGVGLDEYQTGSGGEVSDENIVTLLFSAISNPGKWHNRAKEWFNEHIGGRLSGTMLEVFEAYQHLGATPKGGIQGGYNAAAEFVNKKREEKGVAPISPKGVKKAWEGIKARFPDAFETGLHDRKYNDLMKGLLDENEMTSGFFGGRGYGDVQYDDSRLASIVKRHAYRQQLRVRKASTKTANIDYDWWAKNGRSFKSKTTRAVRMVQRDPKKALKAAEELFAIMERRGYPDNWHRVQRLKEDAEHEIRMQSGGW
ncbi:MAG: hypothetical protein VXX11_07130 [Planctomycetota bacterium]|nr:hypothetical protein [Planctomycetota bacterium]